MTVFPRLALLLGLLALPLPASAQAPFDACVDRAGVRIPSQTNDTMDAAGMAGYDDDRRPMIWWNAEKQERTREVEQLFIYLHECAHHALSHPWKVPSLENEIEADCWAVQLMVEGGMIAPSEWDSLLVARARVRPDNTHLGGEEHVAMLRRCLTLRTDQAAWDSALPPMVEAARDRFRSIRGLELDTTPGREAWESTLGPPGTYGCEVVGTIRLRCLVFTSRHEKAVASRYRKLVEIVSAWLPEGWVDVRNPSPAPPFRTAYHAQDPASGVVVSLLLATDSKLYFVVTAPRN